MKLIRELDSQIPTFSDFQDIYRLLICLYAGILPYIAIPFESLSAPYITREYLAMKYRQRD